MKKKNPVSPIVDASSKKISVLLSASDKRFSVSRMRDFFQCMFLGFEIKPYDMLPNSRPAPYYEKGKMGDYLQLG